VRDERVSSAFALGVCLAIGLIVAGYLMGGALLKARSAERFVTVKGLSEKIVEADLAIWNISFRDAANDLEGLQQLVDANKAKVHNFLLGMGFEEAEISSMPPQITDVKSLPYMDPSRDREFRYTAVTKLTLRSAKVPLVKKALERAGELVSAGIVLAEDSATEFSFTKLNDIKPEMIAEATKSAREAAEQFARDSGSQVGAIRRANQGYFTIDDRDRGSPDYKNVRVVTTVEFFLTNP